MRVEGAENLHLLGQRLVGRGALGRLGDAALQNLHVGENQLQVDGLNIAYRIHTAVHVDDVGILKAADHVHDGVHLADIGEELVSQAFALGCALHQTGDVHELDDCRGGLLRVVEIGQKLQAGIRHRHHAHVGIDGAERIVGGLCACFGQRVE